MMLIVGGIDFFQGLIALFEDDYFVVTKSGFLTIDLTGWGWVLLIWGVLLCPCRAWATERPGLGAVVHDRCRVVQLLCPAGFPRQQPVPLVGADGTDAQHHRALRAHRTVGGERYEFPDAGLKPRDCREGRPRMLGRPSRFTEGHCPAYHQWPIVVGPTTETPRAQGSSELDLERPGAGWSARALEALAWQTRT